MFHACRQTLFALGKADATRLPLPRRAGVLAHARIAHQRSSQDAPDRRYHTADCQGRDQIRNVVAQVLQRNPRGSRASIEGRISGLKRSTRATARCAR